MSKSAYARGTLPGLKQFFEGVNQVNDVKRLEGEVQRLREIKSIIDSIPKGGSKEGRPDYVHMISSDKVARLRELVLSSPNTVKPTTNDWFCHKCDQVIPCNHVTFDERHDERYGGCGHLLGEGREDTRTKELEEAIEAIEDEMCDDFSPRAQRINMNLERIRKHLGITIPGINTEEENE